MYTETVFLQASIRRLPVTIPALVTNGDSAGYWCNRPPMEYIAITSNSLTRQTVIFTIAARFPPEETRDWTHTYTQCDKL